MKIKRFICFVLSLLLMLSSGRYSAFAATASGSNAKQKYYIAGLNSLKASSGTVTMVSNTVDRTAIRAWCVDAGGTGYGEKYLSSSGHYSYVNPDFMNLRLMQIRIPKESLPTSGQYMFSYSFNSDVTNEISSVQVFVSKTGANAAAGYQRVSAAEPDIINTAGEFKRTPILIDFRQVSFLQINVSFKNPTDAVGGTFAVRYEISNVSGGDEVGFAQSADQAAVDTAINTAEMAQATQELVYSQNETNGKLDQIIQHISDQLAAMWDQIAAYLITPWMQQDRDLHDETIETLEDLNTETNTTITEETHWHANFIIEGLKSLFIPSDTYFQATINDLMTWFNDRLGFLGYTLTYLIRLLNGILNAPQNPVIRFPGIHAPNRATNEDYVLLPAMDVNLAEQISMISEGSFNLLEFLRTAGDIVLVLAFIVLLQDKLHEVES